VAQTMEGAQAALKAKASNEAVARKLSRRTVDLLVSWTGGVVAFALVALGAAAIYGGTFALDNVKDRLEPQSISFNPLADMTPEEKAIVGDFAGQKVDTGREAEAYADLIGFHLTDIENADGMTYAELGAVQTGLREEIAAAEQSGDPALASLEQELADVTLARDTVFKGEMLRGTLLNAYGWYTVGQITLWAGIGAVIAGLILSVFVALGFIHARKA